MPGAAARQRPHVKLTLGATARNRRFKRRRRLKLGNACICRSVKRWLFQGRLLWVPSRGDSNAVRGHSKRPRGSDDRRHVVASRDFRPYDRPVRGQQRRAIATHRTAMTTWRKPEGRACCVTHSTHSRTVHFEASSTGTATHWQNLTKTFPHYPIFPICPVTKGLHPPRIMCSYQPIHQVFADRLTHAASMPAGSAPVMIEAARQEAGPAIAGPACRHQSKGPSAIFAIVITGAFA